MEKKDELLREHGSLFKPLSEFLKTEASLIQKYMPNKIIEDISRESSNSRDPKKMKAKVAKLEAKVVDGKAAGNDKKENVPHCKNWRTREVHAFNGLEKWQD